MVNKKVMSLLLAVVMTVGTLAGCGGAGAEDASKDSTATDEVKGDGEEGADADAEGTKYPRNEQGYPDLQGETITVWHNMTGDNATATSDLGEYAVIKELEEKFNVNIEFVHPPVGQAQDNFTIMMADTELPDMIFCSGIDNYYPGGVQMAYEDGILFDYTDYISEENTPNFYNMISSDEFLKKAVTDDTGRIIRLGAKICGSEDADLTFTGPLIRSDYLEATGLDIPETIDDWTELFKAMKENGVEYPLALAGNNGMGALYDTNVFSSAFGVSASGYFVKDDGTVAYGPYEDAYKDYLTVLNEWYEAGYISPDFTTQNEDAVMSQTADDKVGVALIHLYTYGVTYYVTTETEDETKALVPAPFPVLKEGDELAPLRTSSRSLGDYKYITADAKNPEACIALLDALYLEDIDRMLANGVEGVAYEMVDGAPVVNPIPADADTETLLAMCPQQWHTKEDTDLDYILTKKYNKGAQDEALVLWKKQGTEGTLSNFKLLNAEEADVISSYNADVSTYVNEMALKFIMGQESLDNFETYQQNLKDMHVEDLIEVQQAAMDRFEAR